MPTVIFPSGTKIEGLEENTLTPGIVVSIVEQKTSPQSKVYFRDNSYDGIYLYKITAYQGSSNIAGGKTYVTTTEKPLEITIPKTSDSQGIALAGIKESDIDPWRLFNFSDNNDILANLAEVRASQAAPKEYTFNLFRLGTQFALVTYEGNSGNKLPNSFVSSLIASATNSVLVKESKFSEDLTIKGVLKGVELDSIKPTDISARITYRNNKLEEAPIKVNGANVTQTSKADKTVPGYSYYHSFTIDSLSESNIMGTEGEFAFALNLNGVETDSFSGGFLIEFFNKVDSEKILPYSYTEFYTLNKKEVINVTINTDSGNDSGTEGLYELNPTFVISIGKELSASDKKKVEDAVSITNIEPDKITKEWNDKGLTIGFVGNLEPDTTYILSVEDVTDVDGISITNVEDLTFKTKSVDNAFMITYNLDGGEVAIANPTTYGETTETFVLNNPTKEGYDFIGWSNAEIITPQIEVSIEQGSTGNKEFTANYAPISYSITCELDGGQITTDNPASYDITSATITLNNPTREGYTFVGWSGSNVNEPQTTVTIPQGSIGDKIFTANWSAVAYTITYELNGGTLAEANPDGYNFASETFTLNEPTKEGYTFIGWTGSNGDTPEKPLSIVQGSKTDLNYTANWSINSYRLDLVKGTGINSVTGDGLHEYNSVVTASCTMLDGYEFVSWSGDSTYETFYMPASNATMTANAKPIVFNITYDLVGGALPVGLTNPVTYDITSATIILNEPTKEGYTFLGWTGSNGNTPEKPLSIVQGSKTNLNYTANWSINSYRLDLVKGTGINTVTGGGMHEYNSVVTASCTMLDGYEFTSWSGDFTTETFNMPASNATMTANARIATYTITYILDGGSLATSNPIEYNMNSDDIVLNNPTKDGIYFMGWTSDDFFGASMSVKIPQGSTGNKTYTANWGEILTFNLPNDVTLVMHKIPAGVFIMGSPPDEPGRSNNENQHQVTLTKAFYIGRYEVTQDQYFAIMNTNPSYFKEGAAASVKPTASANYPVESVHYNVVTTANTGFLAQINTQLASQLPSSYRFDLPTEAQWEYACRAGTATSLNSGKKITDAMENCPNLAEVGWCYHNWGKNNDKIHSVGGKLPNAWGLYDMHGNAFEWCKDMFADYPTGAVIDPFGDSGSDPIQRGGGWNSRPKYCRSAYRGSYRLSDPPNTLSGFRLVLVQNN